MGGVPSQGFRQGLDGALESGWVVTFQLQVFTLNEIKIDISYEEEFRPPEPGFSTERSQRRELLGVLNSDRKCSITWQILTHMHSHIKAHENLILTDSPITHNYCTSSHFDQVLRMACRAARTKSTAYRIAKALTNQ